MGKADVLDLDSTGLGPALENFLDSMAAAGRTVPVTASSAASAREAAPADRASARAFTTAKANTAGKR